MARLSCALTAAALGLLLAQPALGLLFSSRRGQNLRLRGARYWGVTGVSQLQCQAACVQRGGCRSYNYRAATGECEVFQARVCDHHGYYTERRPGWSWHDAVPDLAAESAQLMWNNSLCVRHGYCRDGCARRLGQYCRYSDQCRLHVLGDVQCRHYRCQCGPPHWQFNSTLCRRGGVELLTDGRHWVWKTLVGGLCSTDVDVRAAGTVQLLLSEDYPPQGKHYRLTIGQTGSGQRVELRRNDAAVDTTPTTETPTTDGADTAREPTQRANCSEDGSGAGGGTDGCPAGNTTTTTTTATTTTTTPPPPLVVTSKFTRLRVSWCNGQLRVGRSGAAADLSWDDPAPLSPAHLAFRTPAAGGRGQWRFPERLVDPWFGADWSPARAFTLPADTVLPLRRRSDQTNFWVEFECLSDAGCGWEVRSRFDWSPSNVVRVLLGVNGTSSAVLRHARGGPWQQLAAADTPDVTSAAQFRRFRIHFASTGIRAYRANDTEPLLFAPEPDPIIVRYDGPYSPGPQSGGGARYRLVRYDARWGAEVGFRWGLVS